MKLSIIIPTFNHGQYIEDCIRSILFNQPDVEAEIIVIDGGSTDNTIDILVKYDKKIHYWVSEKDDGQSHAINKGFEKASGDIMCWINSDDYYCDSVLKRVLNFFKENKSIDFVFGDMEWVEVNKEHKKIQQGLDFDINTMIWGYSYIPQPSAFWKRSVYDGVGGVDENLVCAMDFHYWIKIYKAGFKFKYISMLISCMRSYPQQKNKSMRDVSDKEDGMARVSYIGRQHGRLEYLIKHLYYRMKIVLGRKRSIDIQDSK